MDACVRFLRDDDGAVTIDWVALTSGVLLLGIMVVYAIFNNGVSSLVNSINSNLAGVGLADPGPAPDFNLALGGGDTGGNADRGGGTGGDTGAGGTGGGGNGNGGGNNGGGNSGGNGNGGGRNR